MEGTLHQRNATGCGGGGAHNKCRRGAAFHIGLETLQKVEAEEERHREAADDRKKRVDQRSRERGPGGQGDGNGTRADNEKWGAVSTRDGGTLPWQEMGAGSRGKRRLREERERSRSVDDGRKDEVPKAKGQPKEARDGVGRGDVGGGGERCWWIGRMKRRRT